MLTSFCDDLTLRADELDECHMTPHADAMREAAEIIGYLREFGIENVKLRALVRDMYIHIDQDSECPMCGYEPDGNMYTERVRELGIEVGS